MTLNELIERLEELRDDLEISGNSPIKGAFQPNYPLTASVHAVTTLIDEEGNARIFIALGDAHDYGARTLWEDDIVDSREQEDDEF
jgi:hypothetical protein